MRLLLIALFYAELCVGSLLAADYPKQWFLNAHNCYPAEGRGADRLDRSRRAGISAIEIDLAWSEARKRAVITHTVKLTGNEPLIDDYFLRPMLPELRRMPAGKPGILLIFDFKDHQAGTVQEVYDLLHRLRSLVTACGRRGEPPESAPLGWQPLTVVLSGDPEAIAAYEKLTPDSEPYLAMGNREPPENKFRENVADYFPEPATAFYRVFNFNWGHIEGGRNDQAGEFTAAKRARLEELVRVGHAKGYWLRAWTLNAASLAWDAKDNFGTSEALLGRWRAAWAVGLENVATDEYEMAGEYLHGRK